MTAPDRLPPRLGRGGRVLSSARARQRVLRAALAAVGILIGAVVFNAGWLDPNLQAVTYDTFITHAPGTISNQVTVVALDDRTVTRYGTYPLPRQAYVDLLQA